MEGDAQHFAGRLHRLHVIKRFVQVHHYVESSIELVIGAGKQSIPNGGQATTMSYDRGSVQLT